MLEIDLLDNEIENFEKAIERGEFNDMPLVKLYIKNMRLLINRLKNLSSFV